MLELIEYLTTLYTRKNINQKLHRHVQSHRRRKDEKTQIVANHKDSELTLPRVMYIKISNILTLFKMGAKSSPLLPAFPLQLLQT